MSARTVAVAIAFALIGGLTACGEGEGEAGPGGNEGQGGQGRPSGSEGGQGRPSGSDLTVEESRLIYEPDQEGGNFHLALVLVRNPTDKVAVNVGGQLSVKDTSGKLVKSVNPTGVTILPRSQGLLVEDAMLLPRPVKNGKLEMKLSASFEDPPKRSPVSFSDLRYARDDVEGCEITGTVSNTFTRKHSDLQIEVAGFAGGKLATGGFTYVEQVLPKQDATFGVNLLSPALCPKKIDRLRAYPNLGEEKLTSP